LPFRGEPVRHLVVGVVCAIVAVYAAPLASRAADAAGKKAVFD
jgi:hypothetical protein